MQALVGAYTRPRNSLLAARERAGTPRIVDSRAGGVRSLHVAAGAPASDPSCRYPRNMQVTDRAVRQLTREEIETVEKAATAVKTPETEYMDGPVFDMSLKAKAAGDDRLADTYRLLSGVLRPRVELMDDIDSSTNPFHVTPSSLAEDERALLASLLEHLSDPELRARFADYLWIAQRDRKY